ncbi:hypothetical protein ACSX1A_17380 [Pontibacter sp. MBLB2868]|uniref:hypothetical protein n=1 Tax=Pontibacter sp. MBLB2868 TaxID=3451555 RepID=UPI003F750BAC
MSELTNPLFDNEREFLERQKEEYKNALMGDVDHIKTQSQEIGKKVAVAGGVLLAGYLVKRMFSGGEKKKSKKVKEKKDKKTSYHAIPVTAQMAEYNSMVHEQEDDYTISSERMPHASHTKSSSKEKKSFLKSDVAKVLSSQVVALLMMYVTKKVEEHLNTVSENNDIAAAPVEVDIIETTEYIVPKEDAV